MNVQESPRQLEKGENKEGNFARQDVKAYYEVILINIM